MNTPIAVILYVVAIVAANLSVATFGPISTPINAFLLIGLDFFLRDHLHERWVGKGLMVRMGGLIAVSGFISYALNPAAGVIALASVAAFCASMVMDTLVYQGLLSKTRWVKQNGSNAAGALTDSLVFPTIAFGGLMPSIVLMQFAAKVLGGLFWSWLLEKRFVSMRPDQRAV